MALPFAAVAVSGASKVLLGAAAATAVLGGAYVAGLVPGSDERSAATAIAASSDRAPEVTVELGSAGSVGIWVADGELRLRDISAADDWEGQLRSDTDQAMTVAFEHRGDGRVTVAALELVAATSGDTDSATEWIVLASIHEEGGEGADPNRKAASDRSFLVVSSVDDEGRVVVSQVGSTGALTFEPEASSLLGLTCWPDEDSVAGKTAASGDDATGGDDDGADDGADDSDGTGEDGSGDDQDGTDTTVVDRTGPTARRTDGPGVVGVRGPGASDEDRDGSGQDGSGGSGGGSGQDGSGGSGGGSGQDGSGGDSDSGPADPATDPLIRVELLTPLVGSAAAVSGDIVEVLPGLVEQVETTIGGVQDSVGRITVRADDSSGSTRIDGGITGSNGGDALNVQLGAPVVVPQVVPTPIVPTPTLGAIVDDLDDSPIVDVTGTAGDLGIVDVDAETDDDDIVQILQDDGDDLLDVELDLGSGLGLGG